MPRTPPCGRCWPGPWSMTGRRAAAGGRAGLVVVPAGPAGGPVPAAARGRRARRAGQRRVVRRAVLARLDGAVRPADLAAALEPFHRAAGRAADRGPSRALADALAGRSAAWPTWAGSPRRPRMAAAPWPWPARSAIRSGRCWPWGTSPSPPRYAGDLDGAVRLARQAEQITGRHPRLDSPGVQPRPDRCADRGRGPGRRRALSARPRWPGPGTRATCGTWRDLLGRW